MAQITRKARTPGDLCRVLFRHKKKAVATAVATLCVVVVGIVLAPRSYRSEGKLFVRVGRESVSLDATATTGETISLYESREHEINSVLEILQSRAMLEKVVDRIGPEAILPAGPRDARGSGLAALFSGLNELHPVGNRERAVDLLDKQIEIGSARKSSVITIRCRAESPGLAQKIVAALLDVYASEHVRVNRTAGAHQFFVAQTDLLGRQLDEALESLRDAKNELGLASIEGQRRLVEDRAATAELEVRRAQRELDAAKARVAALRRSLERVPEDLMSATAGFPNVAGDSMRAELYKLEVRERELLSKYTEKHPLVIAVRQQVEEARDIAERQEPARTQSTTAANPAYQELLTKVLIEEASAEALRVELASLTEWRERVAEELRALNNNEVRIAALEREAQLLETNYRAASEKLEQSRVDQALESDLISNVNVVQPATYEARPASPRKAAILMLGLVAAVLGGVGVALLAESFDNPLKTPGDVEEQLRQPNSPDLGRSPALSRF